MNRKVVQRVLGLLLMVFSISMLPPMLVAVGSGDSSPWPFVSGFLLTLFTGVFVWLPVRHIRDDLRLRDGFVIVVMFWGVLALFGAIPLLFSHSPQLTIVDAIFESFSGLTTTGATVITGLDSLPKSILYYRQQLQWLGGMGIIVLAVAILPMLGVGGMQLYRAETPGPLKDSKLTPRITETAKALWYIYLSLTIVCALSYWAAGMTLFDAICHSFSTIAIGGFSTHDASFAYFDSSAAETVCIIFMALAGINFGLHFTAWRGKTILPFLADSEFRAYMLGLGALILIVFTGLMVAGTYGDLIESYRRAAFQVVSFATTTGFTTTQYVYWPVALPMLLMMSSFVGGCAGSTAGGMKVIRGLLLYKQGMREIVRLVHPNAQIPVKLNRRTVSDRVMDSVWGFFSAYVAIFSVLFLALLICGLDEVTAFSALTACLNNLGPGLGDVASHYGQLGDSAKLILVAAMLLGRLEIFTLLALLTPAFWRR